jgi:allantoicase
VLSAVELQGNSHHYHEISNDQAFSHLRFNIYPDGGVARLRVYGIPFRDWSAVGDNEQSTWLQPSTVAAPSPAPTNTSAA